MEYNPFSTIAVLRYVVRLKVRIKSKAKDLKGFLHRKMMFFTKNIILP